MNPSPIIRRHPLDVPGSIKIALGQAASDALAAHRDMFFAVVVHPDSTSPPEAMGRMILIAIPGDRAAIDGACRVAAGKARDASIRTAAKPPPPAGPPPAIVQ